MDTELLTLADGRQILVHRCPEKVGSVGGPCPGTCDPNAPYHVHEHCDPCGVEWVWVVYWLL